MHAHHRFAVLSMVTLACWSSICLAQPAEEPVSSRDDVEKTYGQKIEENKDTKTSNLHVDLVKARSEVFLVKGYKSAYDAAAEYYACRLTWPEYARDQKKLVEAIQDFRAVYEEVFVSSRHLPYFHKQFAANLERVFERDFLKNRLTSINTALMLPGMCAKKPTDEMSAFLTKLIGDPTKHDAIKVYAIKALKDFFPVAIVPTDKDVVRVQALTSYIERKWPAGVSLDELAAISFMRRQAIQVLAHAKVSIVRPPKDDKSIDGQVAVTLLKVLAAKELSPPPPPRKHVLEVAGLEERCYASFGLCDMKPDPLNHYQPDLSVYAVGYCLADFIDVFVTDKNAVKGAPLGPKDERRVPLLPWKMLADQWKVSLTHLVDVTTDKFPAAKAQAKIIKDESKDILESIAQYDTASVVGKAGVFRSNLGTKLTRPSPKVFKAIEVNLGY